MIAVIPFGVRKTPDELPLQIDLNSFPQPNGMPGQTPLMGGNHSRVHINCSQ